MSRTLYAGYVLPSVFDAMRASGLLGDDALRALLRSWCVASVEGLESAERKRPLDDGVVMVAANLVSRGLPTLPSVELERLFAKTIGRTSIDIDETGRIVSTAEKIDASFAERLLDALKAVHPDIDSAELPKPVRTSKAAGLAKVLAAPLTDLFGPAITQLLDVDEGGKILLLPFPFPLSGMYGIRAFAVKSIDGDTTGGLDERGWYQLPVASGGAAALKKHLKAIRTLVPYEAIPLVLQSRQLFQGDSAHATQLALVPIAVARLQRVLIEMILSGVLDLSAEQWTIAVIERDIPGAAIAVQDLRTLFQALFVLEGAQRSLPVINLLVCPRGELHDSPLSRGDHVKLVRDVEALSGADCLIDHSVLLRSGQNMDQLQVEFPVHVTVRTARRDSGMRRVYLRDPILWKGLSSKEQSPDNATPVQQAAEYILQRNFRFASFRPTQRRMLGHALQQKHWLVSMPAGAGKSLMYQYAALLQPAPSFVLEPLASLAMDQQESLHDRWIDIVSCLHESLPRDARQSVRNKFVRGESLFCITTAELFRNEETLGMLDEAVDAGIVFAQAVIDEAHLLSEWSHDHRLSMQGALRYAVRRCRAGKKRRLPLRLLTASASFDVLQDLRRQFTSAEDGYVLLDDQVLKHASVLREGMHYYVFPSPAERDDDESVAAGRRASLDKLLKRLPLLFEELQVDAKASSRIRHAASMFYSTASDNAGVIFCPYPSGPLGVSRRFSSTGKSTSIADSLDQDYLRVGAFIGKDEGSTRVGRQALTASADERLHFKSGATNLLVATRAFGVGSHNRRIRFTVHLTLPQSVDRFVQESGRAGHDGQVAVAALMYTPSDSHHHPDLQRAITLLDSSSSTSDKEKQLIHDILREITYPEDSNTGRIANLLADEYGVELRVNYWQRGLDERMYLQESGNSLGYIDLVTQNIVPDSRYPDQEYAHELLSFAYDHSLEAAGSGPSLSSWVAATYPSDIDDGVARQLSEFDPGADFTIRIGFENDREPILTKIHQILWHDAELEIQRKLLSDMPTDSWQEFCALLEQRSGKTGAFGALDPDVETRLTQLFNKLRSRNDTERIIHRLAILGLVQDYTVHPASRKFSILMSVRSEEEYRGMLERYMRTFMPEAHVTRLLESLSTNPGDSELERCLHFLVDFAYQNPLRHMREGINTMDTAARVGLKHGPAAFQSFIEQNLTAKYANADAIPQALRSNDRFAVLARYLDALEEDESASILENASHLRASGALLSARLQGEPVVRALEMFASLLLADGEKNRTACSDAFVQHVLDCAAAAGLHGQAYQDAIAPLMQRFRRYLTAEETAYLRTGLEEGEKRIVKRTPSAIGIVDAATEAAPAEAAPDINAEKDTPEFHHEQPADDRQRQTQATSKKPTQATSKKPTALKQMPPATKAEAREKADRPDSSSKQSSRKPGPERAVDPVPSATSAGHIETTPQQEDAEIEALLTDIENTIRSEPSSPSDRVEKTTPSPSGVDGEKDRKKLRSRKATKSTRAKADAKIDEAAKLADAMLSEEEKDRLEAKKREEQRAKEEKVAAQQAAKAAAKRKAQAKKRAEEAKRRVDPVVAQQLKWLQTFNTRFLKDYEL